MLVLIFQFVKIGDNIPNNITCPFCKSSNLTTSRIKTGAIEFFCKDCGFKKRGPIGYNQDKAYKFITRKRKKKVEKTVGFPTKKKQRKKRLNGTEKSVILEKDDKIFENGKKIRSEITDKSIPKPLPQIINQESHIPVFYDKLQKTDPPLGDKIEEFIRFPGIQKKLNEKGISQLYSFQEEVYKEILNGNNVVVSAPTGLGKTEAFVLPILHSIFSNQPDPRKRSGVQALLIYPTKALAHDQKKKISHYCKGVGIRVEQFDGDTPREQREMIYKHPPDILITNADMIHFHLKRPRFQALIRGLRFVVVDEIHLCVGSFGTNVLWIMRRLRRFSSTFQCIGSSATISNAKSFAETLFDRSVKLISAGTARRSDMHLMMLYPKERSNLTTMASVAEDFVRTDKKSLVFGNGHLSAESLNIMLRKRGIKSDIHRAGLGMKHRRKVERLFREGQLDAIVSTPTLELGIDIGTLDSVVSMLTGLTSFVQRIGRAGRAGQESFATLVLRGDDPISAYYARNPSDYLSDLEPAFVEPDNPFVAKHQLMSMIMDKPLSVEEADKYSKYVQELLEDKLIRKEGSKFVITNPRRVKKILRNYSIRGIGTSVNIYTFNKKIGERSLPMALSELHPGAIYLHRGNSYSVNSFNTKLRTAKMSKISSKRERTQALRNINPRINQIFTEKTINGLDTAYCELSLTETVSGYIRQDLFTNKVIGRKNLEEPLSYTYKTMGFLISLPHPSELVSNLNKSKTEQVLGGTFHAIEHVLIESGNAFSGGGSTQIGGISLGDTGLVFCYDGSEGGSGLSKLLYDSIDKGLKRSLDILENCPCKRRDGCPRCTYSYQCGNNNQPLNRIGAVESLKRFGKDSTELFYNFEGLETFVIESDMFSFQQY